MDRYLSVDALNDIVDLHHTRSISSKMDKKLASTSSSHLEESNFRCPPFVEKESDEGQVTRTQGGFLVSPNSTRKNALGKFKNKTEGNKFMAVSPTALSHVRLNIPRGFPLAVSTKITPREGKIHHIGAQRGAGDSENDDVPISSDYDVTCVDDDIPVASEVTISTTNEFNRHVFAKMVNPLSLKNVEKHNDLSDNTPAHAVMEAQRPNPSPVYEKIVKFHGDTFHFSSEKPIVSEEATYTSRASQDAMLQRRPIVANKMITDLNSDYLNEHSGDVHYTIINDDAGNEDGASLWQGRVIDRGFDSQEPSVNASHKITSPREERACDHFVEQRNQLLETQEEMKQIRFDNANMIYQVQNDNTKMMQSVQQNLTSLISTMEKQMLKMAEDANVRDAQTKSISREMAAKSQSQNECANRMEGQLFHLHKKTDDLNEQMNNQITGIYSQVNEQNEQMSGQMRKMSTQINGQMESVMDNMGKQMKNLLKTCMSKFL